MLKPEKLRIIFMGTPDFAVESLRQILEAQFKVVGVITMPDKPAGRGQKLQFSPVKEFAIQNGLHLMQPEKLKDLEFLNNLRELKPDLGVVVAFRMLPELVWKMPKFGTINLHGSLLPQYRGAAPINWAIINGETETGFSIFQLKQQIDTGDILAQEKLPISLQDNAGSIHDKMSIAGAKLLVETIKKIESNSVQPFSQADVATTQVLKPAPKIFKQTCKLTSNIPVAKAHNLIRGLSPYPAAWAVFVNSNGETREVKIFESKLDLTPSPEIGCIHSDNKSYLHIGFEGGTLAITQIQPQGKRIMAIKEYLAGNKFDENWNLEADFF